MSESNEYNPARVYRKGENVPRHGSRHGSQKKRSKSWIDRLNAQRIGPVAGGHKASVESGRRKKKVGGA